MEKILTADFSNGASQIRLRGIWQHDYGAKLKVKGIDYSNLIRVDFAGANDPKAYPVVAVQEADGTFTAKIPKEVTDQAYDINAYIYVSGNDAGYTVKQVVMPVQERVEADPASGGGTATDPYAAVIEKMTEYKNSAENSAKAAAAEVEKVTGKSEQIEQNKADVASLKGDLNNLPYDIKTAIEKGVFEDKFFNIRGNVDLSNGVIHKYDSSNRVITDFLMFDNTDISINIPSNYASSLLQIGWAIYSKNGTYIGYNNWYSCESGVIDSSVLNIETDKKYVFNLRYSDGTMITDDISSSIIFSENFMILPTKQVTPQMFGAKADGNTDDTKAVQKAIDYASSHNCVLYIPAGLYVTTEQLNINSGCNIIGANEPFGFRSFDFEKPTCTVIYLKTTKTNIACMKVNNQAMVNIEGINFMSNVFYAKRENEYQPKTIKYVPNVITEAIDGLDANNANTFSNFRNLSFYSFSGTGLKLGVNAMAINITTVHCFKGIQMKTDSILTNFRIQACSYGLSLATAVTVSNGRIEEISYIGIYTSAEIVYSTVSNVFIDQVGYCGIGAINGGTIRASKFDVDIARCCGYYSGYSSEQILSDDSFLDIAAAKISMDARSTIDDVKIIDSGTLSMRIDDSSEVTVRPLALYMSNPGGLYYEGKIYEYLNEENLHLIFKKNAPNAHRQTLVDKITMKKVCILENGNKKFID